MDGNRWRLKFLVNEIEVDFIVVLNLKSLKNGREDFSIEFWNNDRLRLTVNAVVYRSVFRFLGSVGVLKGFFRLFNICSIFGKPRIGVRSSRLRPCRKARIK